MSANSVRLFILNLTIVAIFNISRVKAQTFRTICRLPSAVEETSGIEITSSDLIWTFNDSGGEPELYLCDTLGNLIKTIYITNARNRDWEDITQDDEGNLYIGDFGNNENNYTGLTIYKIADPTLADSLEAEIISFSYPDQYFYPPSDDSLYFDCESVMWKDHYLYLCTKNRTSPYDGLANLYRIPDTMGTYLATKIGSFNTGGTIRENHWITAGDISDDGKRMCLVSSDKLWLFYNYMEDNFFSGEIKQFNLGHLSQKEAVAFRSSNQLYITDEEGPLNTGRNLYLFAFDSLVSSTLIGTEQSTYSITPNPFIKNIEITSPVPIYRLILTDIQGSLLKEMDLQGQKNINLNVGTEDYGITILQLFDRNNRLRFATKLIKLE